MGYLRGLFWAWILGTTSLAWAQEAPEFENEPAFMNRGLIRQIPDESDSEDPFERVAQCFERDWSQVRCDVDPTAAYQQEWIDRLLMDPSVHFVNSATELAGRAWNRTSKGDRILEQLGLRLKRLSAKQALPGCQSVCASLCVSSRLIEYRVGKRARYLPVSHSVEKGYGECNEYSRIAQRLLNDLGIRSETANSILLAHSYLKVWVDDRAYYAEPMNDQCVLYEVR